MASCPRCGSRKINVDLAADARIYISFWSCAACGQQGVLRLIDRAPADDKAAPAVAQGHRPPLRGLLPGRALRRPPRERRSRA